MRAYKFYSAKWGRDALAKNRLKLTTAHDINDPFELTAVSLTEKRTRRAFRDWRDHMFSQIGLISFCEHWSNPVIWSHYAESHRGICLGVDLLPDHVVKVEYVKERLSSNQLLRRVPPTDPNHLGARLLRMKFEHWQYESEVRVFFSLHEPAVISWNGFNFVELGNSIRLREVILGALYEPVNDAEIDHELKKMNIRIRTARLAFKNFAIMEQKMASLKKVI